MTMLQRFGVASLLLVAILSFSAQAQTSAGSPQVGPSGHQFGPPCWKQAGISQSVMPQLRQVHQTMRSEAESVCSDSSLTPEQKREKIQGLHQEAQQRMESLLGPRQMEALRSCQQQRSGNGGGMHHGDPCRALARQNQEPMPQHP